MPLFLDNWSEYGIFALVSAVFIKKLPIFIRNAVLTTTKLTIRKMKQFLFVKFNKIVVVKYLQYGVCTLNMILCAYATGVLDEKYR